MANNRIEYIDYLKGFSIIWMVWYHTIHPSFVDYSFRIPLFIFVSGIFFRPYPIKKFIKKKINTLIIPFIFFYLIYYVFYIALCFAKYKDLSDFNFSCIFELFDFYKGYENFTINPPLWFICALINLQILLYIITSLSSNKVFIFIISLMLTILGVLFSFKISTPFMFGRSLNYFIYFAMGYLVGTNISSIISKYYNSVKLNFLTGGLIVIIIISLTSKQYITPSNQYLLKTIDYVVNFSIICCLMYVFNLVYKYPILKPFNFFGVNSYIVLGMHEIYHTTNYIILENTLGEITITIGLIQTIITLLMLWPTILIFNKYIPSLIGKKAILPI